MRKEASGVEEWLVVNNNQYRIPFKESLDLLQENGRDKWNEDNLSWLFDKLSSWLPSSLESFLDNLEEHYKDIEQSTPAFYIARVLLDNDAKKNKYYGTSHEYLAFKILEKSGINDQLKEQLREHIQELIFKKNETLKP